MKVELSVSDCNTLIAACWNRVVSMDAAYRQALAEGHVKAARAMHDQLMESQRLAERLRKHLP